MEWSQCWRRRSYCRGCDHEWHARVLRDTWSVLHRLASALSTGLPPAVEMFFWVTVALMFAVAALMARHNLRREEVDRAGAKKFSALVSTGALLSGVSQAHHTPVATDEVLLLLSLSGWILLWAMLFWLIYMALEPGLRRLWPHTLITWTRLMSGRVRDALVGRDVLAGVAIGMTLVALHFVFIDEPAPNNLLYPALESLRSARHFLSVLAQSVAEAPQYALAGLFTMLIIRTMVRKTVVAAILTAVLVVPITSGGTVQDSWALALYGLALGLVSVTVVLRLGLLAWSVALLVQFLLTRLPITLDTNAWYYESSLLTLLLIGGLAAYGCLTAVQARSHRAAANTLPI